MFNKTILILFQIIPFLIFIQGCKTNAYQETRIILNLTDSTFKKLKGKMFYLESNHTLIDSILINQKRLTLKPNTDNIIFTDLYRVLYWDIRNGVNYLRPIGFPSPYSKKPIIYSAFLLEEENIEITVDESNVLMNASFKGSKQNEPHFKQVYLSYSIKNEKKERMHVIQKNIELIKCYPKSAYLLNQLYTYRAHFTVEDLKQQLNHFIDCEETKSIIKNLNAYYPYAGKLNSRFPDAIILPNNHGNLTQLNTENTYQLLIFWASWCMPCRAEIPELKQIYSKYGQKHVRMYSISIDGNDDDWKTALAKEAMPWPQLIANNTYMITLNQYFSISQIPVSFLFDEKGNLVSSFEGHPSNMLLKLDSIFNPLQKSSQIGKFKH